MKIIFITVALGLACIITWAQVPQTINFQAQASGKHGKLLEAELVKIRFSILEIVNTGTPVYIETHTTTTDNAGLFNLSIGGGTVAQGNFTAIDWAIQPKFLKVELDVSDGNGFKVISTVLLVSVPYALYAAKADTVMKDSDKQTLSIVGNELSITKGNTVTLPDASASSPWNILNTNPTQLGISYSDGKTGTYEFSNDFPADGSGSGMSGLTINNSNTNSSKSFLKLISNANSSFPNLSTISLLNPFGGYSLDVRDSSFTIMKYKNYQSGSSGNSIFRYRPDYGFQFSGGHTHFNQRVGIGTSNFPLDIATPLQIRGIDSQNLNIMDLIQFNDNNDIRRWHLSLENKTDLNFVQTGVSQDRLFLKGNGNIGIGTRNPVSKLSVNGVIESSDGGIKFPDGTVQATSSIQWDQISPDLIFRKGRIYVGDSIFNNDPSTIVVANNGTGYPISTYNYNHLGASGIVNWLIDKNKPGDVSGWALFTINGEDQTGTYLGFPTAKTARLLASRGASHLIIATGCCPSSNIVFGTNEIQRAVIKADGNIHFNERFGVGSSDFPTDIPARMIIKGIGTTYSDLIQFNDNNNIRRWHLSLENETDLNFVQTGISQDRLYLKANGNVGIGTKNPQNKLSVDGIIESSNGGVKFPDGTIQNSAVNSELIDQFLARIEALEIEVGLKVAEIDTTYNEITIGSQVWMKENLRVSKYKNGDPIPTQIVDTGELQPKYQWAFNNDEGNVNKHGRLYTWFVVTDPRGLCPAGWHVPTDSDWTTLTNYLGGQSVAGGKLKETGNENWIGPNVGATNVTGFTAIASGLGSFNYFGYMGETYYQWSLNQLDSNIGLFWRMSTNHQEVQQSTSGKRQGFSMRCIKD